MQMDAVFRCCVGPIFCGKLFLPLANCLRISKKKLVKSTIRQEYLGHADRYTGASTASFKLT